MQLIVININTMKVVCELSDHCHIRECYMQYVSKRRGLNFHKYKLGYFTCGSTAFKSRRIGCSVPSAARVLLGPGDFKCGSTTHNVA